MAKNFLVFFVVILLVFSLALPCSAEKVEVEHYTNFFAIWNPAYVEYTETVENSVSLVNWANSEYTDTFITVGFTFPMLPYLEYQCDFTITQENGTLIDWFKHDYCVGSYVLQDSIYNHDFSAVGDSVKFGEIVCDKNHLLGTQMTYKSAVHAEKTIDFSVLLKSSVTLDYDYLKCVTFEVSPKMYIDDDRAYRMQLNGVTIYYNPAEIGTSAITQMENNAEQIRSLGVKVDTVDTKIDGLSTTITNGLSSVKDQVKDGCDAVKDKVGEMQTALTTEAQNTQNAIKDSSDKAHQDSQNTQNAIKDSSNTAHEDAGKTQDAIKDLPGQINDIEKDEGNKASADANNELGGITSDLSGKDIDSKNWIAKFTDFWNVMGSTNVATTIQLPQFEVFGYVFWDAQTVDLAPFFEYCAPLVKLVKFLLTLSVLWAMLRYFYNCVQFALGTSDLTLSSTIFSFNPFKIK